MQRYSGGQRPRTGTLIERAMNSRQDTTVAMEAPTTRNRFSVCCAEGMRERILGS